MRAMILTACLLAGPGFAQTAGVGDMTGLRPMRGQARHAAPVVPATPAVTKPVAKVPEYRGGEGSPRSSAASNTTAANTRSEIAPRLPDPGVADTPVAYLQAARQALGAGRTGAAQEALERAETRVLTRSTVPGLAGVADTGGMAGRIGAARRALGANDTVGARRAIDAALAGG